PLFTSPTAGNDSGQERGPVQAEAELAAIKNGGDANQTQTRVITSLIWRAMHPADIAKQIIDSTMEAAQRSGLKWDRAAEEKQVNKPHKSQSHSLFEKNTTPPPAFRLGCQWNSTNAGRPRSLTVGAPQYRKMVRAGTFAPTARRKRTAPKTLSHAERVRQRATRPVMHRKTTRPRRRLFCGRLNLSIQAGCRRENFS